MHNEGQGGLGWLRIVGPIAAVGVLAAAGGATFTRLLFDDFELASEFDRLGWFGSVSSLYRQWSGRVVMNLGVGPIAHLGKTGAMLTGPLLILWWWLCLSVVARRALRHGGLMLTRVQAASVGSIATAALLVGTASPFQTTRWISGTLVYGVPVALALTAVAISLAPRRAGRRAWSSNFSLGLCMLLSSGGNETQALVQPMLCCAIVFCCWRTVGLRLRPVVAAACATIGACTLLLAPGARRRAGLKPASHAIGKVTRVAWDGVAVFGSSIVTFAPIALITLFALGRVLRGAARPHIGATAVPTEEDPSRTWRRLAMLGFIGSSAAAIGLPAYALDAPAPLRAYLPAWAALAAWSVLLGWRSAERYRVGRSNPELVRATAWVVIGLCSSAPIALAFDRFTALPAEREHAHEWGCIDHAIRTARTRDVVVAAPEMVDGVFFLLPAATARPNVVTAHFYGVRSLRARPGNPCASVATAAQKSSR